VIPSSVLPAECNVGYQECDGLSVRSVNGRRIGSISDLTRTLVASQGEHHGIAFEASRARREVVLDALRIEAATAEVLKTYDIHGAARLPAADPPEGGTVRRRAMSDGDGRCGAAQVRA